MTLEEIIADLEDQIAWRGPGGQPQGHIVMPRSEAMELLNYTKTMHSALTKLSDPLLLPMADGTIGIAHALAIITNLQNIAKGAVHDNRLGNTEASE